uniref:Cytochrome P450 n=1 Tax=Timema shepardi TaxID=629360 RepID=A0A7R9AUM7_TIMSH|nr:unnamed protein product [Timema shepardi]
MNLEPLGSNPDALTTTARGQIMTTVMCLRYLRGRALLLEHLPYIETLSISRIRRNLIRTAFLLKTLRVDTLTGTFLYAGSRNCIGQRFAMLDMKSTVSKELRTFKLLPGSSTNTMEELTTEVERGSTGRRHLRGVAGWEGAVVSPGVCVCVEGVSKLRGGGGGARGVVSLIFSVSEGWAATRVM